MKKLRLEASLPIPLKPRLLKTFLADEKPNHGTFAAVSKLAVPPANQVVGGEDDNDFGSSAKSCDCSGKSQRT